MSEDGGTEGLSREVKQQIKRWVLELRHMFEGDFARQLRRFGIEPDGEFIPAEELDYLTDEEKRRREVIEATIRREAENEQDLAGGVKAYVRDAAYTYINRLVGLKCMEGREILFIDGEATEVITTRPEYGGRSRVLWRMRDADPSYREATAEERLWRDGLTRAFEAVTEEIKLLFDPDHEFSQLFPSHAVLMESIEMINEQFALDIYAYPDFLGWVYQFFNVEEKEQIRSETRGKPRTSHELAVLNQFYTPEWIVKFLVDNTLGRIWLQMHPDTRLYWLNRIPAEYRDLPREEIPQEVRDAEIFQGERGVNIDYLVPDTGEDEPIDPKPVGEVTLLDPACGTMHFGQYAYALYYQMYLEELERAGEDGWPRQASVPGPEAIPTAILERNLHGIDIDERAIQIAALTLMLTMKEQAKAHGLDPRDVHVRDMNLVVADAVNLGEEEMETFLQRLDPTIFGGEGPMRKAVQAIWDSLEHVAELGSLIQPGEEVERALSQPLDETAVQLSFAGGDRDADSEVMEITERLDADSIENARDYLLMMLQEFAAENGEADVTQRLFAKETEKGLRLIGLMGEDYDAVVMNPPYGYECVPTRAFVKERYPHSKNDISTCCLERACSLTCSGSYIAGILPRSYMFISRQSSFRTEVVGRDLHQVAVLELGIGVLDDATNRTAATVFSRHATESDSVFVGLDDADAKERRFMAAMVDGTSDRVFRRPSDFHSNVYDARMSAYWLPTRFLESLSGSGTVEPDFGIVRAGLSSGDDSRFVRQKWEIPNPADRSDWIGFNKGGDFSPYYYDYDLVLAWNAEAKEIMAQQGNQLACRQHYGKPGVSYPRISEKWNSFRRLPQGFAFSDKGPVIVAENPENTVRDALLCAILNSRLARAYFMAINPERSVEVGEVRSFPLPGGIDDRLAVLGENIHDLKLAWDRGNELATVFEQPWPLGVGGDATTFLQNELMKGGSLSSTLDTLAEVEEGWSAECQRLQDEIDEIVYDLYDISEEDRELIERELGDRPKETVWPEMAGKSREEKRLEHVERLLSYFVKTIVEEDPDGIVPLVQCGDEPTMLQRVREKLDETFGADRGHEIEVEISNELGSRTDVESWLARRYFRFHINLYKRRPIFWHISSADRSFGAIVHYHRFDHDALLKLRAHYLSSFMQRLKTEMGRLRGKDDSDSRQRLMDLEESLEAAQELDEKLGQIAEGDPYAIEVPWKDEDEQPRGWRPDLDDGVKVNIQPFIDAGVFPFKVRI